MTISSRSGLFTTSALACALSACATAQPTAAVRDACAAAEVRPEALRAHVHGLTTRFALRDFEHPENLARAAAWLSDELAVPSREELYEVEGHRYVNLIATFGPLTPQRLVIGAHYDTAGDQPGADDNASGVAGILELARLLKTRPPRMRTELALFTLEEPPNFRSDRMGSAVHAARLAREKAKVKAMISVEMIGFFSDLKDSQHYPPGLSLFYPRAANFIAVVGKWGQGDLAEEVASAMRRGSPLPVAKLTAPALVSGVDFSDHLSFWNHGFPAVMVTDTSFLRNANYHEKTDTEDTLDYARMAEAVRGLHCAIRELASG